MKERESYDLYTVQMPSRKLASECSLRAYIIALLNPKCKSELQFLHFCAKYLQKSCIIVYMQQNNTEFCIIMHWKTVKIRII